ncbi:MAG: LuxR C-terminal-related transcriptional regulator [Pseudomonadota bacterium]
MAQPAASSPGFALTKIQPPRRRAQLIARPALEQRLAQALATQALVLVSAPAGFGKTAAITRQLDQLPPGTALAWVAADEDDDLGRLAACLVAALEPFDLPWRTSPEALVAMQDGQRATWSVLATELLNALAATEVPRGLVVLDDVHRLADPAIFQWLDALLQHLPPHWCLLIAGRSDPPLALPRLRAQGALAEFRLDDLRFSGDEVAALVQQRAGATGLDRLPQQAQLLLERTQGWPAGLNLALAHAGSGSAAGGSLQERHVFDYLTTEVVDNLAPALREFLLCCAVLPELDVARCAAVSGQSPVQVAALLEEIERQGLFVSVRGEAGEAGETVLCLHDLFRDCLLQRLRSERPDDLPRLLRLAADTEPDLQRRFGYLARAGAWAAAEALLCSQGPALLARGAVGPLLKLIAQLPAEQRAGSAPLLHLRGLCAWAHWDILTMVQCLAQAVEGHARDGNRVGAQRAQALRVLGLSAGGQVPASVQLLAELQQQPLEPQAEISAWQARCWHALADSRMDDVAAPLGRMMDLLEQFDDPVLWLPAAPLTSFVGLAGTRPVIQRYIAGALRRTPEEPPSTVRVLAQALQAGLWLWQGEVEQADALLAQVDTDCRWLNRPPNLNGYFNLFQGLTQAVLGRHDLALGASQARLDGLDDERTSGRREVWLSHFLYAQLRLAMVLDDADMVRAMAARLAQRQQPQEVPFFVRERLPLPGHLAALDGRWADAASAYAAALDDPQGVDLYGQTLEIRLRLAHARLLAGQSGPAAAALAPVFQQVATSGEPGPVLFAGARLLAALADAAWGAMLAPEALAQLRAWAQRAAALRAADTAAPAVADTVALPGQTDQSETGRLAALSPREVEVLARIAAGDSNKLIARAFDLSPHTVKRHVANILDKLALASRGQAAAWYRGAGA